MAEIVAMFEFGHYDIVPTCSVASSMCFCRQLLMCGKQVHALTQCSCTFIDMITKEVSSYHFHPYSSL